MLMFAFQCIIHLSQAENPSFPHLYGVLLVVPIVPPSLLDAPSQGLSLPRPARRVFIFPISEYKKGPECGPARSTSLSRRRRLRGNVTGQSHLSLRIIS